MRFIPAFIIAILLCSVSVGVGFRVEEQTTPLDVSDSGLMDSAWPTYCHDNQRTGRSPYSIEGNNPVLKWKFRLTDGWPTSSPAIDNEGTIGQYSLQLIDFFRWLDKDPDHYVKDCELLHINNPTEEINYRRMVENDIRNYYKSFDNRLNIYGRKYAPLSRKHHVYTVKNFFEFHHTELSKRFWQDFKKKHNGASIVIEDISPTQEQIQKLLLQYQILH